MTFFRNKKAFHSFVLGSIVGVVLFQIATGIVWACSIMAPHTIIEVSLDQTLLSQDKSCLDQNCLFTLEKYESGLFSLHEAEEKSIANINNVSKKITISNFLQYRSEDKPPFNETAYVEALDALIENDISDLKPLLLQQIELWKTGDQDKFLSGYTTLMPYDPGREAKLLYEKNQLLECDYAEYKRAGAWLITNKTIRDYCYSSGGGGGMCPHLEISYPKFLTYLFTNINAVTILYLIIFSAVILCAGVFAGYLVLRKEVIFFLKPRKMTVIVTVITAIILSPGLLLGIAGLEIIFRFLLLLYLAANLLAYIRNKRKQ